MQCQTFAKIISTWQFGQLRGSRPGRAASPRTRLSHPENAVTLRSMSYHNTENIVTLRSQLFGREMKNQLAYKEKSF